MCTARVVELANRQVRCTAGVKKALAILLALLHTCDYVPRVSHPYQVFRALRAIVHRQGHVHAYVKRSR
jgi:hypothetical protein